MKPLLLLLSACFLAELALRSTQAAPLPPPAGSTFGMGYGEWKPTLPNECSKAIHDSFWVHGPDGRVYATWHSPNYTDPSTGKTCYFGHEHGHDPKLSKTFGNEAIPFGYANEMYMRERSQNKSRHEDHVGHKIQVQNDIKTWFGNDNFSPAKRVVATCDALVKVHMGVHSNDAFTNNLHELFVFVKCSDGRHVRVKLLNTFGTPGMCEVVDSCPPRAFTPLHPNLSILPISPPDSPSGDGHRKMVDLTCVKQYWLQPTGINTPFADHNTEHWVVGNGLFFNNLMLAFNPYLTVYDPIRFFDPENQKVGSYPPTYIGYGIDQCYLDAKLKARGPECDRLIKAGILPPNAWNSTRSPFKGSKRNFSPNRIIVVNNSGRTTIYTDALLKNPSFTPFPNSIEQYVEGNVPDNNADIFMDIVDFKTRGLHAPN